MTTGEIIFIITVSITRIAGLVCGTILVLNSHIWEGLVLGVIPFLASAKYTNKSDGTEQNI